MLFFFVSPQDLFEIALHWQISEKDWQALWGFRRILSYLERSGRDEDLTLQVKVLLQMGQIYLKRSELLRAQECFEKGLHLAREVDPLGTGNFALQLLGEVWLSRGQAQLAVETLENCLQRYEEQAKVSDWYVVARVYRNLGLAYMLQGQYKQGLDSFQKAILAEQGQDHNSLAQTILFFSYFYYTVGQYERSREHLKAFQRIQKKVTYKSLMGFALTLEAVLMRLRGFKRECLGFFRQGEKILRRYHLLRLLFWAYWEMGWTFIELEEKKQLGQVLEKIQRIQRKMVSYWPEDLDARLAYLEAYWEFWQGEEESALEILTARTITIRNLQFLELLWPLESLAGRIHLALGNREEAKTAYVSAMETLQALCSKLGDYLSKEQYLRDPRRNQVFHEAENLL